MSNNNNNKGKNFLSTFQKSHSKSLDKNLYLKQNNSNNNSIFNQKIIDLYPKYDNSVNNTSGNNFVCKSPKILNSKNRKNNSLNQKSNYYSTNNTYFNKSKEIKKNNKNNDSIQITNIKKLDLKNNLDLHNRSRSNH